MSEVSNKTAAEFTAAIAALIVERDLARGDAATDYARGRREMAEEAARVCESETVHWGPIGTDAITDATKAIRALVANTPEPAKETGTLELVRHLKRGTEYEVLGEADAQVSGSTCPDGIGNGVLPNSRILREGRAGYESDRLTVYRCVTTGKLWCRFTDEFRDGRFETITPPAIEALVREEGRHERV